MRFLDTIRRAKTYLEEHGRVSLRALKREFGLDDDSLEELVEELRDVQKVVTLDSGVLSWDCTTVAGTSSPAPASAAGPAGDGERRQLTVMFCDLVGSTALSERLDAEDLSEVMAAYQKCCASSIENFDGYIAQYLGDGVLVYFSYPHAHEDDAVRAIHAALRIVDEIPRLNRRLIGEHEALRELPLQTRIGIHTGPVVVSEMGGGEKRERLALGDTVNIAARLEAEGDPGSIVVSGATRHLARGAFVFDDLGERLLKGIEEPVALFRPRQATGVQSRLALAGVSGLTPLVGRERQTGLLLECWEEAKAGHGQVVLLSGEAGMGKSRMIEVLREHVADEPHTWHEYRGSAYHQNSAFYPVIEFIERVLLFTVNDTPEERVGKLTRGIKQSGFPTERILPLVADFLGLPLPENLPALALSPEEQRKRTIETLCLWPLALAQRQPLIFAVEDLHWFDPSSVEVAGMEIAQIPAAPILFVATFRPEFKPPWPSSSRLTHLPLEPLSPKQAEAMVGRTTGGKPLPDKVREQIVAKTDGVPLFVEELTKSVLESGLVVEIDERYERTDPLPDLAIPSTLQDSLMARLDRLGPAKDVAQLAAILGREFTHELLGAVSALEPNALEEALAELVDVEVLYRRGVPPHATYTFKHALIQDTARQSLLRKRQRELHGRVAQVIEERFPEIGERHPELLAHHCERAGFVERAIVHWREAAERAQARSAHAEAIHQLQKAIALLDTLPEERTRDAREVALQMALGASLIAARGYAHAETGAAYERALALVETLEEPRALAQALVALSNFTVTCGDPVRAVELGERALGIAEEIGDRGLRVAAHAHIAVSRYYEGQFHKTLEHSERSLALYDAAQDRELAFSIGTDQGVTALAFAALALCALGYPDRAVAKAVEGTALARELKLPFSLAYALVFESVVHYFRRDALRQAECAEEIIELAGSNGFPLWLGVGQQLHASARAARGESAAAAEVLEGLMLSGETGQQAAAPTMFVVLADAYKATGMFADGLGAAEAGLEISTTTGQAYLDADLYRLKAELGLATGGKAPEAEAALCRGLDSACEQGARLFELRVATSLATLWSDRDRRTEARDFLAPIYAWFTEGFDTQDLKDAKALLDELT
jgi:class 3 adenylate cyclase/tetratricopeptide (TPR) repeat protein